MTHGERVSTEPTHAIGITKALQSAHVRLAIQVTHTRIRSRMRELAHVTPKRIRSRMRQMVPGHALAQRTGEAYTHMHTRA